MKKIFSYLFIFYFMYVNICTAGYQSTVRAIEEFENLNFRGAVSAMMPLAEQGNCYVIPYLKNIENTSFLTDEQKVSLKSLPQYAVYAAPEKPAHLTADFLVSRVIMNFRYQFQETNSLYLHKDSWIGALQFAYKAQCGRAAHTIYQFATQETLWGKQNTLRQNTMMGFPKMEPILTNMIFFGHLLPETMSLLNLEAPYYAAMKENQIFKFLETLQEYYRESSREDKLDFYKYFLERCSDKFGEKTVEFTFLRKGIMLGDSYCRDYLIAVIPRRIEGLKKENIETKKLLGEIKEALDPINKSVAQVRRAAVRINSQRNASRRAQVQESDHVKGLRKSSKEVEEKIQRNEGYIKELKNEANLWLGVCEENSLLEFYNSQEAIFDNMFVVYKTGIEKAFPIMIRALFEGGLFSKVNEPQLIEWEKEIIKNHKYLIPDLVLFKFLKNGEENNSQFNGILRILNNYLKDEKNNLGEKRYTISALILSRLISDPEKTKKLLKKYSNIKLEDLLKENLESHNLCPLEKYIYLADYYYIYENLDEYISYVRKFVYETLNKNLEDIINLTSDQFKTHINSLNLDDISTDNLAPILNRLGHTYMQGRFSISNEDADRRAVSLFKKAAKLQNYYAMYNLGILYQQGRGGLEKNIDHAIACMEIAHTYNPLDLDICYHLFHCYVEKANGLAGQERENALEKANEYNKKNTEAGHELGKINQLLLNLCSTDLEEDSRKQDALKVKGLLEQLTKAKTLEDKNEASFVLYVLTMNNFYNLLELNDKEKTLEKLEKALLENKFDLAARLHKHFFKKPVEESTSDEEVMEEQDLTEEEAQEMGRPYYDDIPTAGETSGSASQANESSPQSGYHVDKKLIKKFQDLFDGKSNQADTLKLVEQFDRQNGTNLLRSFGKSHKVHGSGKHRDTYAQERNRRQSAKDLFEEHGITQDVIDFLIT